MSEIPFSKEPRYLRLANVLERTMIKTVWPTVTLGSGDQRLVRETDMLGGSMLRFRTELAIDWVDVAPEECNSIIDTPALKSTMEHGVHAYINPPVKMTPHIAAELKSITFSFYQRAHTRSRFRNTDMCTVEFPPGIFNHDDPLINVLDVPEFSTNLEKRLDALMEKVFQSESNNRRAQKRQKGRLRAQKNSAE